MKRRQGRRFAIASCVALACLVNMNGHASGIPTLDIANLAQTIMSATENAAQTAKQIQQYQVQLQQYENQLRNTLQPSAYLWEQASRTMTQLRGAIDTLNEYRRAVGGIEAYLSKFGDASYYKSLCFSERGCTPAQWAAMEDSERLGSQAQKKANDALFRGLDQQQAALSRDSAHLERLQRGAQGAQGQMAAIQFANQFASQQANQLLQIRGLLIAQQSAEAARAAAVAAREAKALAAHEAATQSRISVTPAPKKW